MLGPSFAWKACRLGSMNSSNPGGPHLVIIILGLICFFISLILCEFGLFEVYLACIIKRCFVWYCCVYVVVVYTLVGFCVRDIVWVVVIVPWLDVLLLLV